MKENQGSRLETMSAFFDHRSAGYDQHMKENVADFEEFYQAVADQIPSIKSRVEILDLGCGTGLELEPIFRRCPEAHITGIDLSSKMLSRLEGKFQGRLEQLTLVQDSYLNFVPGRDRFDYCVSVMTLHHLLPERKRELYSRIRRALKPGGLYIEGDYVVSRAKEVLGLAAYLDKPGMDFLDPSVQYHLDLPLSRERQLELFQEAGFTTAEMVWDGDEAAVFTAGSDPFQADFS